ncbi:MAG: hypothetical protein WD942_00240 [Dehalococcoidia bacterium]
MNRIDLEGQVAVVTGGAQGLGYAIAHPASGLKVAKVRLWGPERRRPICRAWNGPIPRVESEVDPVSILVNYAGITGGNSPLETFDPACGAAIKRLFRIFGAGCGIRGRCE